jgi:hypothetical protein
LVLTGTKRCNWVSMTKRNIPQKRP